MTPEQYRWCFDHIERFQVYTAQPYEIYDWPKPCLYFLRSPDLNVLFPRYVRRRRSVLAQHS